jgi:hypothetical protein
MQIVMLTTFTDGVEASLFTGDNDIGDILALVPSFWGKLDASIAVKHGQDPICIVSTSRVSRK